MAAEVIPSGLIRLSQAPIGGAAESRNPGPAFIGSTVAWREMTADASDNRLRYLLPVSGPVPWQEKAPLLDRLSRSPQWQPIVLAAVEAAISDALGSVDVPEARKLLARIPAVHAGLLARLDELETNPAARSRES